MLSEVRKQKGISQTEMASKLGISLAAYNHYENGKRKIPQEVVSKICKILEIDESFFLASSFTIR